MAVQLKRRSANRDVPIPEHLHPLVRRIYSQRPLRSSDDLLLGLDQLLSPGQFKGMECAVDLLQQALRDDQSILVVGDFDADGATSCAVATLALRAFGCRRVDYLVPNRFEFGYGLSPEIVALARQRNPDLIITVDNGISSLEGVAAARAAGIRVLITDHHLAADELPAADAIVNPNQPGCEFPSKSIAGVGVIFYVMMALRARLREAGWFAEQGLSEPRLAELLDLVALGTVADVVALDRNNRILVREGLRRIRGGRTRPGILALLEVARRKTSALTASDLGFAIAPRLNAAGRLEDMSVGIECLLAPRAAQAYELAQQLDAMNQDRKKIETDMRDQAFAELEALDLDADSLPAGLCLYDARWHQGVVGILASRVKDRVHRPVIAFADVAPDDPEGELKGSARSIPGLHMRDALDAVASQHPGLISKFGGHAMAAGLSLPRNRLAEFREAFAAIADRLLSAEQLTAEILSDGELQPEEFDLSCAEALREAGPWGQAFPEPLFDGRFRLINRRRVGDSHLKMVLCPVSAPQCSVDAIAFNLSGEDWPDDAASEVSLAYRLDCNEFRGRVSLQLMVERILAWY